MTEEATPKFDFSVMRGVKSKPWNDDDMLDYPSPQSEEELMAERQAKRDYLIYLVSEGLLSPSQADEIAIKERLGPLSSRFRHGPDLNPELSFWNIEMTAVWISEKSVKAVHRHYEPYYADITVWVEYAPFAQRTRQTSPGTTAAHRYRPVVLEKARFEGTYYSFSGKRKTLPPLTSFFPALRGQLAAGEISAVGTPLRPGIDSPHIAAGYWQTADFDVTDEEGASLRLQGVVIFRDIQFNVVDLLKLYPPSLTMRIAPGRVRPWKTGIKPKEAYKIAIVDKLRVVFPRGLPDWHPKKNRDGALRQALGSELTMRWRTGSEEKGYSFNDEAFCIAMDRILKDALEPSVVWLEDFSKPKEDESKSEDDEGLKQQQDPTPS